MLCFPHAKQKLPSRLLQNQTLHGANEPKLSLMSFYEMRIFQNPCTMACAAARSHILNL